MYWRLNWEALYVLAHYVLLGAGQREQIPGYARQGGSHKNSNEDRRLFRTPVLVALTSGVWVSYYAFSLTMVRAMRFFTGSALNSAKIMHINQGLRPFVLAKQDTEQYNPIMNASWTRHARGENPGNRRPSESVLAGNAWADRHFSILRAPVEV